MNKFSYKMLFYSLLFFLLIKNIYYINIEQYENIFIFFITYMLCYFFIDNNLVKVYLCIIIPDIIYFEPIIEGKKNISDIKEEIMDKGRKNAEKHNEEEKKKNKKLGDETKDPNSIKKEKGFTDQTLGDKPSAEEKEFGNMLK